MNPCKKMILPLALFIGLLTGPAWADGAPRPSHERFQTLLTQLKDHGDDAELRKSIIELAHQLHPAPAIPEEARAHFVKAVALQKEVTSAADYTLVLSEYQQALLLAPWWGDAYYNQSVALDGAGQLDGAIGALKLYLLTGPSDTDARSAQDKLYALEARQEKKANAAAAEEQKRSQTAAALAELKSRVSGVDFERWTACMTNPQTGAQCSGVNAQEKEGSHWWGWPAGKAVQRYVFSDDHVTICFIADSGEVNCDDGLLGTPNGPNARDIVWEQLSSGPTPKKRVWSEIYLNGEIIFSNNRPVNSADFDPNMRYYYWWYKRH